MHGAPGKGGSERIGYRRLPGSGLTGGTGRGFQPAMAGRTRAPPRCRARPGTAGAARLRQRTCRAAERRRGSQRHGLSDNEHAGRMRRQAVGCARSDGRFCPFRVFGSRFGTSAEFWLNLQVMHELEEARRRMRRAA